LKRRKKSNKGWDGEVYDDGPFDSIDDKLASFRNFITTANPDGSATTHVKIECTLADIAEATNLRIEDAAFAMQEVGLLDRCGQIRKPGVDRESGCREESQKTVYGPQVYSGEGFATW
jgi:histone acetyltransferase MYST1